MSYWSRSIIGEYIYYRFEKVAKHYQDHQNGKKYKGFGFVMLTTLLVVLLAPIVIILLGCLLVAIIGLFLFLFGEI